MQHLDQAEDSHNASRSTSFTDPSPPSRSLSPLPQSTSTSSPPSDPSHQAVTHEESSPEQGRETTEEAELNERDSDLRTTSPPTTQWTEPEAGFASISLNDDPDPSPSPVRRSSTPPLPPHATSSTSVHSSSSPTRTPPRSESASTAPTTTSPSSPSASTNDVEQVEREKSGMSKPPDSSKVEQPSPVRKGQSTKAPSMMQRVVSMTRQRDLPPKSKEEEVSSHNLFAFFFFDSSLEMLGTRRIDTDHRFTVLLDRRNT